MSQYSITHERANVAIHVAGFVIGLIAFPILFFHALKSPYGSIGTLIGVTLYGISFIMVFGFSSLYHYHRVYRIKKVMRMWDHISIYYLIAGTYTPFILRFASYNDTKPMLLYIWLFALVGTAFKVFFTGRYRLVSTLIYLAMGWMILTAPITFKEALTPEAWTWIIIGGVFYTVGVAFYLIKMIPYHHAIWHFLVLAGALSHFIGVWVIYSWVFTELWLA